MSFLQNIPSSEKSSVQVAVRVRPKNAQEASSSIVVQSAGQTVKITNPENKKVKSFNYDYVYDVDSTQEQIYNDIGKQIIDIAYKGYNACVFAYGQTGCFAKGTDILMNDRTRAAVENIKIGDKVCGDDSTPRTVLKLFEGVQSMYTIVPNNKYLREYTVNEDHILVLRNLYCNTINEISVGVLLYMLQYYPDILKYFEALITEVEFPEQLTSVDPYIAGQQYNPRDPVPDEYLNNSLAIRRKFLRGVDMTNIDEKSISPSFISLLHSVGIISPEEMTSKSLTESLDASDFPNYVGYKFDIRPEGYGQYYGFMLDGNHRFIGAGYNVLRNSGKSHTMTGNEASPGLIPRICQALFAAQSNHNGLPKGNCHITYKTEFSYLEIYSEKVRDLMRKDVHTLDVREHPEYGPYVDGLSQILVEDDATILHLIDQGNKQRAIASTAMNSQSSRSHAILTLYFTQIIDDPIIGKSKEIVSRINLVDLAGSERVKASGVTGTNFNEMININLSLTTLGIIIAKLVEKSNPGTSLSSTTSSISNKKISKPLKITPRSSPRVTPHTSPPSSPRNNKTAIHIPFRDSKLTHILKESLGGNSKTYMIATISPVASNFFDSMSTLRYADNAKQIINTVRVNEDTNDKIIRVLKNEIAHLKEQLRNRNASVDNDKLRQEIAEREELIKEKDKTWAQKLEDSTKLVKERFEKELSTYKQKIDAEYKQLVNDEINKTRNEYEKKQLLFEKGTIVATFEELEEKYEKKIESIRRSYEEQFRDRNTQAIQENERLKQDNIQLKEQITQNEAQISDSECKRALLSKQVQQLHSRIHILEQAKKVTDNEDLQTTQSTLLKDIESLTHQKHLLEEEIRVHKNTLELLRFEIDEIQNQLKK